MISNMATHGLVITDDNTKGGCWRQVGKQLRKVWNYKYIMQIISLFYFASPIQVINLRIFHYKIFSF